MKKYVIQTILVLLSIFLLFLIITLKQKTDQLKVVQNEVVEAKTLFCVLQASLTNEIDTCTSEKLRAIVKLEIDDPLCK